MRTRTLLSLAVVTLTAPSANAGRGPEIEPTLVQRATLSADHIAPGPPSGALASPANGRTGPLAGQVIPGSRR
jgi:glycerophosphoryl diester phosphodiesterase